ncbi:MAG: class I SAM-dependent methyltransferase [Planctomycetota bacterium]|nr:class I SAM-dependent methyltransferase [Planctomycetota bacterium]
MTTHGEHDQDPYDPTESAAQAAGVGALLGVDARLLDLGCGTGRVAARLLKARADLDLQLVGVDLDEAMRGPYLESTMGRARFQVGDIFASDGMPEGPFDAILALGNLVMLLREPPRLRAFYAAAHRRLVPGGVLVIDDFAEGGWAELASGRWADGIDETGSMQMLWLSGDPEFVVRMGEEVDPDARHPGAEERVLRLWSRRELDDAAELAGFAATEIRSEHLLAVHRRGDG